MWFSENGELMTIVKLNPSGTDRDETTTRVTRGVGFGSGMRDPLG